MTERLSSRQIEIAKKGSKSMENKWRIFTYPKRYSQDKVEEAIREIKFQKSNIEFFISDMKDKTDPDIYDKIFMGIYHHSFYIPPELKYLPPNRN